MNFFDKKGKKSEKIKLRQSPTVKAQCNFLALADRKKTVFIAFSEQAPRVQ